MSETITNFIEYNFIWNNSSSVHDSCDSLTSLLASTYSSIDVDWSCFACNGICGHNIYNL